MAASMSSAEATPSSTIRMASSAMATPSREEAKLGASLTTTAVFFSASTQLLEAAASSSVVFGASTTSTNCDADTGLKKCRPQKLAGRCSWSANLVMDSEDVFVASQAVGESWASTAFNAVDLRSKSSGTASTTRPQAANDP